MWLLNNEKLGLWKKSHNIKPKTYSSYSLYYVVMVIVSAYRIISCVLTVISDTDIHLHHDAKPFSIISPASSHLLLTYFNFPLQMICIMNVDCLFTMKVTSSLCELAFLKTYLWHLYVHGIYHILAAKCEKKNVRWQMNYKRSSSTSSH